MSDTPNVLFIGVDQLRADNLGCYGNPICETPHLDALERDGVVFERAYTPCSLCTPARASMLTGLFAFTHGMGTNCDMLIEKLIRDAFTMLHWMNTRSIAYLRGAPTLEGATMPGLRKEEGVTL